MFIIWYIYTIYIKYTIYIYIYIYTDTYINTIYILYNFSYETLYKNPD